MKIRSSRRSVSPFGTAPLTVLDPHLALKQKLAEKFGAVTTPPALNQFEDLVHLPYYLELMTSAFAQNENHLERVIQFLVRFRDEINTAHLADDVFAAMEGLFNAKVDDFILTHHDRETCEKMGWTDEHRNSILYVKERDALIGRFFVPFTEASPGQFSGFLSRWIQSERLDHLLHFLDFCRGSNNPTFEYFLLFSNPAFHRILTNKTLVRGILHKTGPMLKRLSSPTWEKEVRTALAV